jgi:hypothetical protein
MMGLTLVFWLASLNFAQAGNLKIHIPKTEVIGVHEKTQQMESPDGKTFTTTDKYTFKKHTPLLGDPKVTVSRERKAVDNKRPAAKPSYSRKDSVVVPSETIKHLEEQGVLKSPAQSREVEAPSR